jgi:hypothetical protein
VERVPTGASSDRGVIPRAMQFIFQRLSDEAAKVMMVLMMIIRRGRRRRKRRCGD